MPYTHLSAAVVAAALAAAGTYKVEEWRFAAKEKQHAEQHQADERSTAAANLRRADAVTRAQNAAASRQAALRRDADSARASLDSLRNSISARVQNPGTDLDAWIDAATTLGKLFNQCAEEYEKLGERADRHVSDIRTLMEAWPR